MNQKNSILLVLLLIQIGIIAYAYRPANNETEVKPTFFPDLSLAQVRGMQITDEDQNFISLAKVEGTWQIGQGGFPADSTAIEGVLNKIIALKSNRLVSRTRSSQVRLKISDEVFNRKIVLQLTDDTSKTMYLGNAPSHKSIHFRLADSDEVFIVKDLAGWEVQTDKESWWKKTYEEFRVADLSGVTINNEHGTLILQKDEGGNWQSPAEDASVNELNQEAVGHLIESLQKISISKYLSEEKPAAIGDAGVTIEYQGQKEKIILSLWPEKDETNIIKASNNKFYAEMRTYQIKDVLEAQLQDFIKIEEAGSENKEEN